MDQEEVWLEADGVRLVGTLTLPGPGPAPLVVAVHGAEGGTRDFHLFRHLEATLPLAGVATLVYDRRGEGESSGDASSADYHQLASDVRAWVQRMGDDQRIDAARIGLWGISQGGWIAPLTAANSRLVAFLIAVSAAGVSPGRQMVFATTALMRGAGFEDGAVRQMLELRSAMDQLSHHRIDRETAQRLIDGAVDKPWFKLAFVPRQASLIDTTWAEEMEFDIRPALRQLRIPVLLFFGEHDRWIPVAESADAWRAALGPGTGLTVVSLPGTGHAATFATNPDDWLEAGPVTPDYTDGLISWLRQHTR